jgi:MFS family permease
VLALALAPIRDAVPAGVLLYGVGVSFTLFTANANALVQLGAPDHLRGRLIGLYLFAFVGLAPIGGLFAGWLAELGGTALAFGIAGATSLVTIAVAGAYRRRAQTPGIAVASG